MSTSEEEEREESPSLRAPYQLVVLDESWLFFVSHTEIARTRMSHIFLCLIIRLIS